MMNTAQNWYTLHISLKHKTNRKCNTYQYEKKHEITGRNHKTCFTSTLSSSYIYLVLLISYLDKINLQSNMKITSSCTSMLKQMMRLNTRWDQFYLCNCMLQITTTTSTSITATAANSNANDNIPSSCSVYSFSVNT